MAIREQLKDILCDMNVSLIKENIEDHHYLEEHLNLDSIDFIELIMTCELKFKIYIQEEEITKIKTFGNLVNYLESKINEINIKRTN